jgi:hypothetical protein
MQLAVVSNMCSAFPKTIKKRVENGLTLREIARMEGLDEKRQPIVCRVNNDWILQKNWSNVSPREHDIVIFVAMPQGTTGRLLAALAVTIIASIVAPYLAAPLLAGLNIAAGTTAAVAITSGIAAALTIGGVMVINAILPLPGLDSGLSNSISDSDTQAPTYAFTASSQQNIARLGGSIPVLYGRQRIIPDLAATAWYEWVDGVQFLYQVLLLTQGEIEVEDISMGRTPISSLEDVQTQLVSPGGTVTLFMPEVYQAPDVSASGIPLAPPNDLPPVDDGTYGPFAATPPGITTDRIGIDITFPRGLYDTNETTGDLSFLSAEWLIEIQKIDDAGAPIGDWQTLAEETFDASLGDDNVSSTGLFMGGGYENVDKAVNSLSVSYRYTLPEEDARWQVRVTRTDDKNLSVRAGHDVSWSGLRAFMSTPSYGEVSILAVKTRASASVNSSTVRRIAVTGTRKLPVWDNDLQEFSEPVATQDIAPAVMDMILNQVYGGRRSLNELDIDHLVYLDGVWKARGDKFNAYISQGRTLWSAVQAGCKAGRGVCFHQAGTVRFHRDEAQTICVQSFSRQNIVRGTFEMEILMPLDDNESDGIEYRYFDERVWNYNTLRLGYDGGSDPENPLALAVEGITDPDQASRELAFEVQNQLKRRVFINFDTDMEGAILARGSLIKISHDMPSWGQSTRVLSYDPETRIITLDARVDYMGNENSWFVYVRDKTGVPSIESQITVLDEYNIQLPADLIYQGGGAFDMTTDGEFLHIVFGKASDKAIQAVVLSVTPRAGSSVRAVRAVMEDDTVHVN